MQIFIKGSEKDSLPRFIEGFIIKRLINPYICSSDVVISFIGFISNCKCKSGKGGGPNFNCTSQSSLLPL